MSGSPSLYPDLCGLLTGGPADRAVVRYAAALAARGWGRSISFVSMPLEENPDPARGGEALREFVSRNGGNRLARMAEFLELPKENLDAVLRHLAGSGADLLIAGRRLPGTRLSRAAFHQQLARKAPCDVLLVSPHSEPRFGRPLVPVDFSDHSALAVRTALRLQATEEGRLQPATLVNVSSVHYGFSYTGHNEQEFADAQEEAHRREFVAFLKAKRIPRTKVDCFFLTAEAVPRAVSALAAARGSDLVVVGSRGLSRAASILLGSTAADLIAECASTILVVKIKGETRGFLDALLPG